MKVILVCAPLCDVEANLADEKIIKRSFSTMLRRNKNEKYYNVLMYVVSKVDVYSADKFCKMVPFTTC